MKKLTFTVAIILCAIIVFAQEKESKILLGLFTPHDENPEYVFGPVKEIKYQSYFASEKDGKIVKGDPINFEKSTNVTLWQPMTYIFNQKGEMIQVRATADSGAKIIGVLHNENGKRKNVYWLVNDTLVGYNVCNYNSENEVEYINKRVTTDEATYKRVFQLDKNGFLLNECGWELDGTKGWELILERDDSGVLKRRIHKNEKGKVMYDYDNFKFNSNGLQESARHLIMTGEKIQNPGQSYKILYEYDDKGNWIRSTMATRITERSFVYYK
ncbi:MAG: hypothetical protein K0B11_19590 [Mariniphaga sp.]|nr:hypothetical protein [Mariniphaga sp.]